MGLATLKLFNTLKVVEINSTPAECKFLLEKFSVIVSKDILKEYSLENLAALLDESSSINKINNTFFSILQTLETSDNERHLHQFMHYLSTYGYEQITGSKNTTPYLPIKGIFPEYKGEEETIYVNFIKGSDISEIQSKIKDVINSNAGVNTAQAKLWSMLAEDIFNTDEQIALVKGATNKDLRSIIGNSLYPKYVPEDVEEMIRLAIIRETDTPIKINSKSVLSALRCSDVLDNYFNNYKDKAVYSIAKVWRRNRNYFLAMKQSCSPSNKTLLNRARKLADKTYQKITLHPVLNATVADDLKSFKNTLPSMTTPQLIKVINACSIRTKKQKLFLTRVRNGSLHYSNKQLKVPKNNLAFMEAAKEEIKSRGHLRGVKVFVPENITLKVPTSSKDLIGFIPNFSYVDLDDSNLALGVQWYNDSNRIDLDLSFTGMDGTHIGWNSSWSEDGVSFSGDVVDAPKNKGGAAEFISIGNKTTFGKFDLTLYSMDPDELDPGYTYKIFLNQPNDMQKALELKNDYLLRASRTIFEADIAITKRNSSIGYLLGDKFLITNMGVNSKNISAFEFSDKDILDYLSDNLETKMSISEYVALSGAKTVNNKKDADISLDTSDLNSETWDKVGVFK